MPFETGLVIAGVVLLVTFIAIVSVVAGRHAAAKNEERKQQASMRGWSFESTREKRYRVHRWKGVTDGVEWTAESRERPGGHEHRAIRRSRWVATAVRGPEQPILCMGVTAGKEVPKTRLAQGDGMIANLAKKAATFAFDKAVDAYFGDEIGAGIDAAQLKPVPGTTVPGYTIMAADVDAASRILFQGLTRALTASPAPALKHGDGKPPWVLLWKDGIALGKAELIDSIEELEGMTRLGSAVARLPIA
jgi:hypothetical protein